MKKGSLGTSKSRSESSETAEAGRTSTVADAGDVRTERSRDPELDRANR